MAGPTDPKVIIFQKNEKDEYFRKSIELAASDVSFREDTKASGGVERLGATVLKGIQDQLFDYTRQKKIEDSSRKIFDETAKQYRESFVANHIANSKRLHPGASVIELAEQAERAYNSNKKTLDRLAEKEAWRLAIKKEVPEDDLLFRFDAKSIAEYAKVNGGKRDRMYHDVKQLQNRFNQWQEKKFDMTTGEITIEDVNGVLFPHSVYRHGANSYIEIRVSREMLHCILFLNKHYLRYHHETYIRVETPNAIRLYELLIMRLGATPLTSPKDELTLEYLQKKFNTKYKHFRQFLQSVINPALSKINQELGTEIKMHIARKVSRSTAAIDFEISPRDRKILLGQVNDDLTEAERLSLDFFVMQYALGGERIQGDMKVRLEEVKARMAQEGVESFGFSGKHEAVVKYRQNLQDAEKLESLIENEPRLSQILFFDKVYMNAADKRTMQLVGATASDSLDYINEAYLIPMGIISPALPPFGSTNDEQRWIQAVLPFELRITESRKITIDETNFDSMKSTIMSYVEDGDYDALVFGDEERKRIFCDGLGISLKEVVIPAEIVEEESGDCPKDDTAGADILGCDERVDSLTAQLTKLLGKINVKLIDAKWDLWQTAIEELAKKYEPAEIHDAILYLGEFQNNSQAKFYIGKITTPKRLLEYFEEIDHQVKLEMASGAR